MHRYKTEWYSIRLPVSTRDFDVSSCVMFWRLQKGAWGERSELGQKWGAGSYSGKEGELEASGAERVGSIQLSLWGRFKLLISLEAPKLRGAWGEHSELGRSGRA